MPQQFESWLKLRLRRLGPRSSCGIGLHGFAQLQKTYCQARGLCEARKADCVAYTFSALLTREYIPSRSERVNTCENFENSNMDVLSSPSDATTASTHAATCNYPASQTDVPSFSSCVTRYAARHTAIHVRLRPELVLCKPVTENDPKSKLARSSHTANLS